MANRRFFDAVVRPRLRPTSCRRSTLVLLLVFARCAAAQIDTDPANDSQSSADALSVPAGTAITNTAALAAPDNDVDFFTVELNMGDTLLGMATPIASLPADFDVPDTMASVLSGGIPLTFSDDDGSNETPDTGMGRGSMFRLVAPSSGTYHIGVTGFEDYELDGNVSGDPHVEAGPYVLTVGRFNAENSGGAFVDTDPANNVRAGADSISSAAFTAQVGIGELLAGDVDFYRLNLREGQFLSAMTAPLGDMPNSFRSPDTMLGLFEENGTPLIVGDDAGDDSESPIHPSLASDSPYVTDENGFPELFGSGIRALIPADGVYYLGVTGYPDDDFVGDHNEVGRYAMLIGVAAEIPEPTTLTAIVVCIALTVIVLPQLTALRRPAASSSWCKSTRSLAAPPNPMLLLSPTPK
ncbi:MAG TPA: hypothetical protein VHK01_07790, partial [Lacipirellulaceae bacterium]|nr:hypothetical protein [Lacipirellulaceae bacterium]